MSRLYFRLLFLSYLNISSLLGQTSPPLDSLVATCNAYPNADTTKVNMLLKISIEYMKSAPAKGVEATEEAIIIAKGTNSPIHLIRAMRNKSANQSALGLYDEAIITLNEAITICKEYGKSPKMESSLVNNLGIQYFHKRDFKNAYFNFEQAYKAKLALGDLLGATNALGNMGNINLQMGDYPQALLVYDEAIALHDKLHDQLGKATVLRNKGKIYNITGDYPKALSFFFLAKDILEKDGQTLRGAELNGSIGEIYYYLSDYAKSIEYYQKALDTYTAIGHKSNMADLYINIAGCYLAQKKNETCLDLLNKALPILLETNNENLLIDCYNSLGAVYYDKDDYTRAFEFEKKALSLSEKLGGHLNLADTYRLLGDLYIECPDSVLEITGISSILRNSTAEEYYIKSINLAQDGMQTAPGAQGWKRLSALYERTGQFKQAYDAFQHYITIKDSIAGEDVKKQITRKEIQYEFDKKEASLKFEQQLTKDQLEKQQLLSLQQQQALRLNQQSLALSNKEKDLQHLAYLKEKAEKQEKEQALSLAEIDKQLQDVQLGALLQEKALQLKTLAEKNALIGFLLAGISAVLLAFAAFYWWIRQRQAKKEAAIQAQFTRQLLEHVEDDRGRIAIDLHDSVSHDLLLLKQSIRKEITGPEVGDKIDGIINGIRQISRNLHPVMLDKIGLGLSLETLCEQFMLHETIFVSHEVDYQHTLSKSAELQLFRIVQEGLTNALKYAKAEAVKVQLKSSGNALRLEIQDNGIGFEVEKALEGGKAFGLHSILQRAKAIGGKAEIRSGEGGTIIRVVVG